MTELMVGTKKGLFALEGEPGGPFEVTGPRVRGRAGRDAIRDARTGRVIASVTSPFYGPKLWIADDPAGEWEQASGVHAARGRRGRARAHLDDRPRRGRRRRLRRRRPRRAVREPRRRRELGAQPRPVGPPDARDWQPGGGGLCLHSIATWPGEPDRLAVAVSAAGVWLTEDGGETWRRGNKG
jgi:hypothetical protein